MGSGGLNCMYLEEFFEGSGGLDPEEGLLTCQVILGQGFYSVSTLHPHRLVSGAVDDLHQRPAKEAGEKTVLFSVKIQTCFIASVRHTSTCNMGMGHI